jgi:hypothetical protein
MFDPFTAHHPSVLVHEVPGSEFEDSWHNFDPADHSRRCPVCGEGHAEERGVSEHNSRPWLKFSCGDVVAQEIAAG